MIALLVEVPVACFRQSRAREYAETYPLPPPATVYGMLLSVVGETDRYQHLGVELAIALISQPEKTTIIRTFRRIKKKELDDPANARPDFQELLTGLQFGVWVRSSQEINELTLVSRLDKAFNHPEQIDRFGGLSLGESRDLVNSISLMAGSETAWQWLVQDQYGAISLPYWVDHVGSAGTRWQRYQLKAESSADQVPETAWTQIVDR